MEQFKSILKARHYSPSTIHTYVKSVKRSGVNIHDKRAVHRYVCDTNVNGDSHGETYRAMLAYDKFLRNVPLPGGSHKHASTVTCEEACLSQKSRADVAKVYWLVVYKGYKPMTALAYVRNVRSVPATDRHGNVYRARMALKDFNEHNHPRIHELAIRDYYNSLYV